ncbi:hypothetical protein P691DRAFT_799728 [Macrolepiota fuliginosa MF-IS2]|uniref:Histone deacetylase complex subunit SAP18 n=1 Tax=Macrolepiota fuliginosa MF-IS2 TaxID=1400762 RepID=A0A9P5XF44_9AGAR|nr:hypothetical protein P691DRAFT_799728 [Macrolepiota fuliginosa MF-IS2]
MDVDTEPTSRNATTSRETTAPFLIRTFVKIGSFHRLSLFEEGGLPTTDEQQIFTWKDATLREVLTTLRNTAPHIPEYKHPLARFSFRTVYADPSLKGRFAQKDLGMVYSRDILGEPGALNVTAPRLLEDAEGQNREPTEREREERTLDELKFLPGDYLLIAVLLPKNVTMPNEIAIKGTGATGWKSNSAGRTDTAWGGPGSNTAPRGSEGHWRGGSSSKHPPPGSRRGGRNGGESTQDKDMDRDRDPRVPPPRRRDTSPPPPPRGGRGRGGRSDRRSRSRSRSPRRRYD